MVIEQRKTPGIYTWKGRVRFYEVITILVSLSLCIGCSPERKEASGGKTAPSRKINQENFQGVYRAGKAIDGSITVGINYVKFQELLQSLATEISIANDKVSSQDEKKLLEIYSEVLTTYQDSATLWDHKIQHPRDANGETYVEQDQEVSAIAAKYNLSTRRPGGFFGDTEMILVDDSIKVIWAKAHDKLEQASTLLVGKKQ